jgi:hypothetical protein
LGGLFTKREERGEAATQRLRPKNKVLEALHSQDTDTALAFKTANEESEEACALIKAKDAKLKSNETVLNNNKLYLKEQVSEPQLERQPRTET